MTGHTDPRIGRLPMGAGWRRRTWWPVAVVAVVAVAAPALGDAVPFLPPASGWLFAATQALAMLALALTWGTIADVHGRVDLGHAVFVGVGAYTCGGALIALGWPAAASLIAGAAGAALLGGATGALLLRLPAPAFSLATFGLLLLTRELVRSATPLTRGPEGLALPVTLGQAAVYQGMLAACIAALALAAALRDRRPQVAAGMIGQAAAYACLTAVSGLVGALWAAQRLFISPDNAFAAMWTFDMAWAATLGGIGTAAGPLVGGAALFAMREVWPVAAASWRPFVEGVLLVVGVLLLPGGLLGRRGTDSPAHQLLGWRSRAPTPHVPDVDGDPAGGRPQ